MTKLPKVSLRPIEYQDLEKLFEWRNTYRLYKWFRQRGPLSWREHGAWFNSLSERDDVMMFSVQDEDKQLIGVCGLTSIDRVNSRAEFSLYIKPDMHRKGYGEASLRRLLNVAFLVENLWCVWGESLADNPAVRTFKRVGFRFEGERRAFYFREGQYINAHLWSILRSEYNSSN